MIRARQETGREAHRRWPALYQFLAGYLHQDWPEESGTVEAALEQAIADHDLQGRMQVIREWRDWSGTEGAREDPRAAMTEGLGVNVHFERPVDGHHFMKEVYDRLIVSIGHETGTGPQA